MKVSVITPSYNQGRFIERTLRSVASQAGVSFEHVVFDGGSIDETKEILENFSPPVRWVSKPDKGQANAVNKGIQSTDGEIIGWLNSDDIYYPNALSRVVDFFEKNSNIDIVYGLADHIDEDDNPFESYPTEPWNRDRLLETCFICQPALFFRRKLVAEYGFLNESLDYCMDYEYWLRMQKKDVSFAYLEVKLAGSRMYKNNKTIGSRVKVHNEINNMFKNLYGMVPDIWICHYAHAYVENYMSRKNFPKFFILNVSILTILSSLMWNHRVSTSLYKKIKSWVIGLLNFKQ